MKKLLTFLTLLTLSIGVSWAATMTYTPTDNTGAGTVTGGPSDLTLTNSHSGGNSMQSGQGLQILATNSPFTATISGMTSSYKVTKIVVTYCTNAKKGQGTISAMVGENQVGSTFTVVKPPSSGGGNTLKTATLYDDAEGTSFVDDEDFTINITCTENSIYLNKVEINYEENSGPAAVTPPTITLNPASGTYYEGDEVTVTLAPTTEGSSISYNIGDGWTDYTAPFTISETTTIQAKATLNGVESSVKTQDVPFKKSVANIAAFKALSDADAADFKFTGDLVVTYFSSANNASGYVWVKDKEADGYTLLYGNDLTVNTGNIIKGGWTGKRTVYKGLIEITDMSQPTIEQGNGTVAPLDLNYTPHFASTDYQAVYGKLSGVTCTVKNSSNSNFTITDVDGNEIAGHDTYNMWPADFSTEKTYNITGIVSVYNSAQFIPVLFEEVTEDPGDGYYLVGNFNMDGNNWVAKDARYKFSGEGTTLTLNNVNLPDNVQFKIVKWEGTSQTWYGGQTEDTNQQNTYGLHKDWHTNIPLTNSSNNDYVKNFSIAAGAVSNFTLNTTTLKFDIQRDEQLYVKGDFNDWNKTAMNSISTGWTINQAIAATNQFGFVDEWGDFHGGNGYWIYQEEHEAFGETKPSDIGQELDITSSGNFYMVTAGTYTLNVNSNLTKLVVYVPLAINCTATSDVEGKAGGTVVAKVEGNTVTAAQTGETVVLEVTPWNGYTLSSVTLNGSAITANEGVYSFEMPNVAANVVANFAVNYYDLDLQNDENLGEVSGLPQNMKAYTGQEVSFSVTALGENEIDKVTYQFNNGTPQTLTADDEGNYTFNMPAFNVTIKVTYIEPLQPCTIPFVETWDGTVNDGDYTGCTGGNDDQWSGTIAQGRIVSDHDGWEYFAAGGGYKCVKFGTSNTTGGSATTPQIIVSNGTIYKMTFRAGGWGNDNSVLYLSATGAELYSDEGCNTAIEDPITLNNSAWGSYTVYVKASASLMTIKFYNDNKKKRIFLDDVNIDYFETPVPTEATLAEIIALGENADGKLYKINNEDGLLGVYSQGQSVWFKDEYPEVAVDYQDPNAADYEYYTVVEDDLEINKSEEDFDQSNWIEVVFPATANYNNKYVRNMTGTYSCENGNPKLTLTVDVDQENDVTEVPSSGSAYELNPYMAVNFVGNQEYTNNQGVTSTFFFSKPKAQEYAQILWAVWDGTEFIMPTGKDNYYGFEGSFTVNPALNGGVSLTGENGLKEGETYNFHAVIRKVAAPEGSKAGETYEVYPTDLDPQEPIVTAINTVSVGSGNVKSVKYVNVAGIVSDVPFQGVNIVVTEYTDGSRTTTKMLRK